MPHTARSNAASRPQIAVNPRLDKHLIAYVAAATAAGVAALAVPDAAAEVVYTAVNVKLAGKSTYQIDLNHDGVNDFGLMMRQLDHSSILAVVPDVAGNKVVQASASFNAAALNRKAPIGSKRQFTGRTSYSGYVMAFAGAYGTTSWFDGPWKNKVNKYLGFQFYINGEVHYGWARMTVTDWWGAGGEVVLGGYAYETVANKPIFAGEQSGTDTHAAALHEWNEPTSGMATLGMLARGADALPIWRREERAGEERAG